MPQRPRNILLIQTDAQHHRWLGGTDPSGVLRTPHLDKLARRASTTTFTRAYSCSGVCVPSRVSLMTGRYPIAHGVTNNFIAQCPPTEPLLGKMLQGAGYSTAYFGKTHFAGNDDDLASEGWATSFAKTQYNDYLKAHGVEAHYPEKGKIDRFPVRYWNFGASRIPTEHYFENVVGDITCRFIEQHTQEQPDRPFACYVSNVAPHGPHTPPAPYATMYDPAQMVLAPRTPGEIDGMTPQARRWIEQNAVYLNDEELRWFLVAVYGLITLVDDNVGKILATLERTGQIDNTLILFTSDHGDFATRYGIMGKSWCMTDDLLRIPLIVSCPPGQGADGNPAPRQSEALVQTIDLTATMLDWAGVPVPSGLHGQTLLPLLQGGESSTTTTSARDYVFAYDQSQNSRDRLCMSMICDGRWKYVGSTGFKGELYDLQADPMETRNLVDAPEHAPIVRELRDRLLQWHIDHSGGYHDHDHAGYWEDETCFYEPDVFCGERIKRTTVKPRTW